MKSATHSERNTQMLEQNIQRTVANSALRKIRMLVDQDNAEEAADNLFVRRFFIALAIVISAVTVAVYFFGIDSVLRPLKQLVAS